MPFSFPAIAVPDIPGTAHQPCLVSSILPAEWSPRTKRRCRDHALSVEARGVGFDIWNLFHELPVKTKLGNVRHFALEDYDPRRASASS